MPDTTFDIESLSDAHRFQSLLNAYHARVIDRGDSAPEAIPANLLATVYTHASDRHNDRRILWAVIDLELTYLSMNCDVHGAVDVWAGRFGPEVPKPDSVLDGFGAFAGKLDILRHMTAFALRYRAFWDKAMGILFLLYDPSNYQAFARSASRKKFFRRRTAGWPPLSPHLLRSLDDIDVGDLATQPGLPDLAITPRSRPSPDSLPPFHEHLLQIIDTLDAVRTAEAHGAGSLRKWSLAMLPLHESKDAWLINHWNIANGFTHRLRRTLLELSDPPDS